MKKLLYGDPPPKEMYAAIRSLIKSNMDTYDNAEITGTQIEVEFRIRSPRYPPELPIPGYWIQQAIAGFYKKGWRISLSFQNGERIYSIGRN